MAQTTINIRMDDSLKKEFDVACNDPGLTMTAAITMFAKKMTREKRVPLEVSLDPFYSVSNMTTLGESIEQMLQGKTVTETLDELEGLAKICL